MGYFTFTFANKQLIEKSYGYDRSCILGYGYKGYIALPKGFEKLYQDSSILINKTTGYAFIKENIVSRAKKFDDKDSLQFCLDFCERGQRRLKKDSLRHKGYLK